MDKTTEYRSFNAEMRASEDSNTLVGHAAVFNTITDLGYFREKIAPGAFKKTLSDNADVRALLNHNPDIIFGRTKAGTLKLREDDTGLFNEITMPDTTQAKDAMVSVKRGDIDQESFAFQAIQDEWDETDPNSPLRTITQARLFDVSLVVYPAYPTTDVSARSAESILNDYRATKVELPGEPAVNDHTTPTSVLREQLRIADELGK